MGALRTERRTRFAIATTYSQSSSRVAPEDCAARSLRPVAAMAQERQGSGLGRDESVSVCRDAKSGGRRPVGLAIGVRSPLRSLLTLPGRFWALWDSMPADHTRAQRAVVVTAFIGLLVLASMSDGPR